jgi:hypothetical protein
MSSATHPEGEAEGSPPRGTPPWRRVAGAVARPFLSLDVCALRNLVTVGICLRLMFMMFTDGSNDIHTWAKFARQLSEWGLLEEYERQKTFNHSPLIAYWTVAARWVSMELGLPFRFVWKLLPFASDVVATVVVVKVVRPARGELAAWRAAAIFALALPSLWITGHHGNTDSLCALLVLVSALCLDRRRFFLAGLAFAAALNVKLLPFVVFPALVLSRRGWRELWRSAAGFLVGLAPFVPVVLFAWEYFHRNAISYNSHPNRWGIHMILWAGFDLDNFDWWFQRNYGGWFQLADDQWRVAARYVMMGLSAVIGFFARRKGWSAIEMVLVVIAMFLVLTPGIGVQYFVLPLLPLVVFDPKRALFYSLAMGAYLSAVYLHFWDGKWPLRSRHSHPIDIWVGLIGLVSWAALIELIITSVRRRRGPDGEPADALSADSAP